jgi:hypothetical protein
MVSPTQGEDRAMRKFFSRVAVYVVLPAVLYLSAIWG